MGRGVRLLAALALAGLGLVSLPSAVQAENTPWKLENFGERTSDDEPYVVMSWHKNGVVAIFSCVPGKPRTEFGAGIGVELNDYFPAGEIAMSWSVDGGGPLDEIWETRTSYGLSVAGGIGQRAYELALAVASAKKQIVYRYPNGTVLFDAKRSTEAISMLLALCGLWN